MINGRHCRGECEAKVMGKSSGNFTAAERRGFVSGRPRFWRLVLPGAQVRRQGARRAGLHALPVYQTLAELHAFRPKRQFLRQIGPEIERE
jgi:hypothetical protein